MSIIDQIKTKIDEVRKRIALTIEPERKGTPYEIFTYLIKTHPIVSVILDSRVDGVILPSHLLGKEYVQLQYGMNLVRPIIDLNIGADGISATLSFNRKDFKTFVPWTSVLTMFPGNPGPVGPGGSPNLIVLKGGRTRRKSSRSLLHRSLRLKLLLLQISVTSSW